MVAKPFRLSETKRNWKRYSGLFRRYAPRNDVMGSETLFVFLDSRLRGNDIKLYSFSSLQADEIGEAMQRKYKK
jgi:hypothetical protein